MGIIDMFCSSPASTATRRSHHESYNANITPRLIRMLSTPCRGSDDTVAPSPKPAAVSRNDYKQLLQRQKSSSSGGYGADNGMEMIISTDEQLRKGRRRSSADASDLVKVASSRSRRGLGTAGNKLDRLLNKLSDSGTRSRRSSSYDDHNQQEQEIQKHHATANNKVVEGRCSTSTSGSSSGRRPPLTIASSRSPALVAENDSPKLKSSPSGYHGSTDKVVVLWVSLHCKGCEAKVRKHISKMEGVKSFSTDWMTKRVTIISNMDPHDVLASVSTVKYAHFWPSSSPSPSSSYYYSPPPSSSSSSAALRTYTRYLDEH